MASESKNRPSWRIPVGNGPSNARFPGYQSRFGDGHPNRRQCVAVARSTGKRCNGPAMRGVACCRVHGGYRQAAKATGLRATMATRRNGRRALYAIGIGDAPPGFPLDVPLPLSPLARGRLFEAWQNRALAPREWLSLTC
jgi:hypothetical protein